MPTAKLQKGHTMTLECTWRAAQLCGARPVQLGAMQASQAEMAHMLYSKTWALRVWCTLHALCSECRPTVANMTPRTACAARHRVNARSHLFLLCVTVVFLVWAEFLALGSLRARFFGRDLLCWSALGFVFHSIAPHSARRDVSVCIWVAEGIMVPGTYLGCRYHHPDLSCRVPSPTLGVFNRYVVERIAPAA